jgi:cytochrome P450
VSEDLESASLLESLRFTALAVLPNAVQGLFRRRPQAVAAATRLGVDGQAVRFVRGLRKNHGDGPVWVRVLNKPALLVHSRDDVRRVLEGAPSPFAADPEAKRKGMSHFQPDALTLSRGTLWQNRRRFQEAVLDTGRPLHSLADRFLSVAREETIALLGEVGREHGGKLGWEPCHAAFRRLVRRVVLGDSARDDERVSELLAQLMSEANGLPSEPSEQFDAFMKRIEMYVAAAEEGSLVGRFGQAPADQETRPAGQVVHWLFALQDTLAANAFRALALIASHPRQRRKVEDELAAAAREHGLDTPAGVASLEYLEACLQEAMRLWPTTPILSRETLEDTAWNGAVVPAGTQIFIFNTFNHRDPETHEFADHFAPEAWTEGDAGSDWLFNHFSHGPQGCPGAGLALFIGKAVLATVLTERDVKLVAPGLDPYRPLPHMLDYFSLRFELGPPRRFVSPAARAR